MNLKSQVKFVDKDKTLFFATVKKRVDDYFKENNISKNANTTMVVKSIVLLSAYFLPFIFLVVVQPGFFVAMLVWLVMGFGLAGVGMSIMHDANHGAYSDNKTVNSIMGHTLNLVGGSVFNWKLQHNILHHTYTNIVNLDEDIADKLVLRFSPHTKVKKYQKLQYIYAFLFYGIMTLYWATFKDFVQFIRYTRNGTNSGTKWESTVIFVQMLMDKIFYFVVTLGIPLYFGIPLAQVLSGFFLMHFAAGVILTVVFQLAHTVEGTSHPLPNEAGDIENCWAIHQMNTTVDFSRGNPFLTWYLGGLNYQVEHHLFPRICHVHYPAISPIVEQTAKEFGVPFLVNETFGIAFKSHMATLKRFGKLPDLNEAIG